MPTISMELTSSHIGSTRLIQQFLLYNLTSKATKGLVERFVCKNARDMLLRDSCGSPVSITQECSEANSCVIRRGSVAAFTGQNHIEPINHSTHRGRRSSPRMIMKG